MNETPTEYQILNNDQLYAEIDVLARQTRTSIGVHPTICKVLLGKFEWNSEELVKEFHKQEDKNAFLKNQKVSSSLTFKGNQKLCEICFSEPPYGCVYFENCDNVFCEECLEHYVRDQINERNHLIQCPCSNECDLLNEVLIFYAVGNDWDLMKIYRDSLISNYVQNCKTLKDCPGVDCLYRWKSLTNTNFNVKCLCGGTFCFNCSSEDHRPASCSMMSRWATFKRDYVENANRLWISTNSKPCPKCRVNIEKNGGCDHITCRKCKHEFCWRCLNPSSHANWYIHNCRLEAQRHFSISAKDQEDIVCHRKQSERYEKAMENKRRMINFKNRLEEEDTNQKNIRIPAALDLLIQTYHTLSYSHIYVFCTSTKSRPLVESAVKEVESATKQLEFWINARLWSTEIDATVSLVNECREELLRVVRSIDENQKSQEKSSH
ncbi:RBR-type E3 ubiquitin transferase [Aphelenchoides besseyi]|nr:RBR-type E3 ubiquitin transferase [Aphelenchoides besseyi]